MLKREEVARAIQEADDNFGYSIRLVSLVDGVSTYTVECAGETVEVESHGDGLEIVTAHRNKARADAVLALQPDDAMVERGARAIARLHVLEEDVERHWRSFIPDARACLTPAMNREQKA